MKRREFITLLVSPKPNIEKCVVPSLVDKGAGLERLVERLLDHLDDHPAGRVEAAAFSFRDQDLSLS